MSEKERKIDYDAELRATEEKMKKYKEEAEREFYKRREEIRKRMEKIFGTGGPIFTPTFPPPSFPGNTGKTNPTPSPTFPKEGNGTPTREDENPVTDGKIKPSGNPDNNSAKNSEKKLEIETTFMKQLEVIDSIEELEIFKAKIISSKDTFRVENYTKKSIRYIFNQIDSKIHEKEIALKSLEVRKLMKSVRSRLDEALSPNTIGEIQEDLAKLASNSNILPEELIVDISELAKEVKAKVSEYIENNTPEIKTKINDMLSTAKKTLDKISNTSAFEEWVEYDLPKLKEEIDGLLRNFPSKSDELRQIVLDAREKLNELAIEYQTKFEHKNAEHSNEDDEIANTTINLIKTDQENMLEWLRKKDFKSVNNLNAHLAKSEALKQIYYNIDALSFINPNAAESLRKNLSIMISLLRNEIKLESSCEISNTGEKLISIGGVKFPRWEEKTKEVVPLSTDVSFQIDYQSKQNAKSKEEICGDISIIIKSPNDPDRTIRLFEGLSSEDEHRFGLKEYENYGAVSSYMTIKEYKIFKKSLKEWNNGTLKQKLEQLKANMGEHAQTQPENKESDEYTEWQKTMSHIMEEFTKFNINNHIFLLKRIDEIKNSPPVEDKQVEAEVPKWATHWTLDNTTEKYLGTITEEFSRQLKQKEGALLLTGHAGTGKDVLVKMFCYMSNRKYFAFDCTKWTTEFELGEDVQLVSENGATQTLKLPSKIVQGLTTPGAVIYFNEFNAMPQQAQIFLHALFDEKRTMTLKTSSGKEIKADPSVLIVLSGNPNYVGTFEPEKATKSRMVQVNIDYPELFIPGESDDPNPNPMINSAEAMRIARELDSLSEFTLQNKNGEENENEFIAVWDSNINHLDTDAPELDPVQEFDIEVTLALVTFATKLREEFIKRIDGDGKEKRNALPVDQPITGRELRRCTFKLNKMSKEQKLKADPDQIARDLIEKYFLCHFSNTKDKNKILEAMKTWDVKKRELNASQK